MDSTTHKEVDNQARSQVRWKISPPTLQRLDLILSVMSLNMQTNGTKRFTVLDLPGVLQTTSIANQPKSNSAVSADKSLLPSVKKSVESSSEENLYKSTLTIEQRVAVAMTVGEEVVTEEELTAMFKGESSHLRQVWHFCHIQMQY